MKAFRGSAIAKLIIGLLVIALLTGCAYYATFGVAFTVVSADDWAGAVLNMAMSRQTAYVYDYYQLTEEYKGVKEKDIPDWAKENLANYEAMFNPETTNFRYQITDEDGKVLFGNYEGEEYIARSYDWEQRLNSTEEDLEKLRAYEQRYDQYFDYDNNVYLNTGYSRYPIEWYDELPKEYLDCTIDEWGYLYDVNDNIVARVENYADVFPYLEESAETDLVIDEELYAEIVVDGVNYYPVDRNVGYPPYFAFQDDYGNFYDEDLNCIAHNGEVIRVDSTPAPTPTPRPQTESTDVKPESRATVKPIITKLNTVMTAEEYEALYDKCYEEYSIRGYIPKEMTVEDNYSTLYDEVMNYAAGRETYLQNAIGLGIGGLMLLAILLVLAGKRNAEGEFEASGTGQLPWDAWLVGFCCLAVGAGGLVFVAAELASEALQYNGMEASVEFFDLVIKGCTAAVALCMVLLVGLLHSMAARVKVKGWWRNCLCWKALVWCWKWCIKILKWSWKLWLKVWRWFKGLCSRFGAAVKKIPLVWKAAVIFAAVSAVEFIFFGIHSTYGKGVFLALMWHIVKFLVCIIICLMLKRLQQGARTIADGNLDHRIDTKNLYGDFKEHAECLNRIGDGLSHSVDAQLRSERMKTELITNVSHDLKTPLTSIVNYVDLLKKEELTGKTAEYVEVLDRQSARLKKLTEDLVEASKASTGSLNVNVERVSVTELIEQARAEYAVRLKESGLQAIVRQPDEEVVVWADGKYVWRILDNLLSNVCKYAMPNTRVYLELRKEGDNAVVSVKNMSRESLNISAEELMERFVRGDSSRNTEGSGLGLSIAQSLAKLMGGEVHVTIDGDLFKAEVSLPLAK
ncbi:MAG: HAMP domain-containing histidine kinase [Oscillospiraceae bacterium]|nr:HAMP domain-containing histidine kinase [Oscillospiraceae bacterium]